MSSVVRQLIRNVFTSWMGMVITLAVTFFFTPYLIGRLGQGQYGIWSLVFSLVAYMRLADVGMSQAISRFVSKYFASEDWDQLNQVVSSAARIYTLVSITIVAASAIIAFGVLHYFQISPEYLRIARITLVVIGTNQAVTYLFIPFAALLPFHRADIVNYFEVAQLLLQTLAIIVLLELGLGLIAMSLVVLGLNVLSHLIRYWLRCRMFPKVRFSRAAITHEKTRELLAYGTTSLLIVAAWIVVFQTDNIVIGRFLSMEAVALFAVPAAIVTQLRNSINAIAVPIVPTISHIEAQQDEAQVMEIYHKSTRYLYYLCGFICITLIIYGGPFILLWVKEDFRASIQILHILIVPACIYLPQMVANSVLFGVSRHKILLYIIASEGISNIILSVILVKSMGIVGVALGTAIPQVVIYLFIYPLVFHRAMKSSVGRFYTIALRSSLLAVLFALPAAFGMKALLPPANWLHLIVDCVAVGAVVMVGFFWLVLERPDRERIVVKLSTKLGWRRSEG